MRAYRAKVPTQEEADRMAALLMEEEEQAKQKVPLKVCTCNISPIHACFSNG